MYKEKIINGATGEITWRDYTEQEIAQVELALENARKEKIESDKKAAQRQSALNKLIDLGLTEEEIAAL